MNATDGARVRLEEVAEAAGVSKATVSQVMRKAGRISDPTRVRVLEAAERLGYVRNRAAVTLRAGRSTLVGIGVGSLANPFFADLVSGAVDVLERDGYFPMVVNLEDDLDRQQRFARSLRENAAAGAILCPAPDTPRALFDEWREARGQTVTVLRAAAGGAFDHVGVDNEAGAAIAVEHLHGLGHRTVGFLGGQQRSPSRRERLEGWRRGLLEAGCEASETLVEPCEATIAGGSLGIARLLRRRPDISAVLCHQDIVAFGATIGLRKAGIEPGRALSVVGFDDISMSRDWDPALTTVSVTPRELGGEAARLLSRRIAAPGAALQSVLIQPALMVRDSTAAVDVNARTAR